MENNLVKLNEKEMEVFSNELLNDFEMMETFAGTGEKSDTNIGCQTYNGICIKAFCGDNCVFKSWFNCSSQS